LGLGNENEMAAMETGGAGHHGGLSCARPALERVVRPGGLVVCGKEEIHRDGGEWDWPDRGT
jgi:hypothetical protein